MSVCKRLGLFWSLVSVGVWFFLQPAVVWAAPRFFVDGDTFGPMNLSHIWRIVLDTDGETVTAAQTVLNFDGELFEPLQLNTMSSRCSFWAPADPYLSMGVGVTPYFFEDNKIVVSCGFSSGGYNSGGNAGAELVEFSLQPNYLGSSDFVFSNSTFKYIGDTLIPGLDENFTYTVAASAPPTPTPTPRPTPTPLPPSVPPEVETLTASDLQLVEMNGGRTGTSTNATNPSPNTGTNSEAGLALDDTIPPPPDDLEKRPAATPYGLDQNQLTNADEEGDVLSLQSLRELLLPGKSDADKRLVLFNLIALLLLLLVIAIITWRLIMTRRSHNMRMKHMGDLIEGELAVIESKVKAVEHGGGSTEEVVESLEDLKKQFEGDGS